MNSYFSSNKRWKRSTVQNHFLESMDLFDGHIYAKGSLILNMINDYLGQDAFSKGIQHYVKENQHKNVETSDLKKAFEEVTGKNLDWFFKQWVYEPGFPEYEVSYTYNQRNRTVKFKVSQVQDLENNNLFRMPIDIQIDEKIHTILVEDQNLVFELPVQKRPKLIVFNVGMKVPCKVNFNKSLSEWIIQLEEAPHVLDRIAAVNVLKHKKGRRKIELALLNVAKIDEFWGVRKEAIKGFANLKTKMHADDLMNLSRGQDNRVRREIWRALKNYKNNEKVSSFLQNIILTDTKYYSISDAFKSLIEVDTLAAGKKVLSLLQKKSHNDVIRKAAISYYGSVMSDSNYDKLKNLCLYGGTTWDARPEAVYQLSKYVKTKPEALKTFINLLEDPSRSVRKNCIRVLGKYGSEEHFGYLDEVIYKDPILSRDIRLAKKTINKEKNLIKNKNGEVEKLNLKFEEIRKIIN
jgi:aminopeptidase N